MRMLRKHSVELIRIINTGHYGRGGRWIDGTPTRDPCHSFKCLIQTPVRFPAHIAKNMPEGFSISELKEIYTEKELYLSSDQDDTQADILVWRDKHYEVFESSEIDGPGRIQAWRVYARRKRVT